jgi:hypothetical protein
MDWRRGSWPTRSRQFSRSASPMILQFWCYSKQPQGKSIPGPAPRLTLKAAFRTPKTPAQAQRCLRPPIHSTGCWGRSSFLDWQFRAWQLESFSATDKSKEPVVGCPRCPATRTQTPLPVIFAPSQRLNAVKRTILTHSENKPDSPVCRSCRQG